MTAIKGGCWSVLFLLVCSLVDRLSCTSLPTFWKSLAFLVSTNCWWKRKITHQSSWLFCQHRSLQKFLVVIFVVELWCGTASFDVWCTRCWLFCRDTPAQIERVLSVLTGASELCWPSIAATALNSSLNCWLSNWLTSNRDRWKRWRWWWTPGPPAAGWANSLR